MQQLAPCPSQPHFDLNPYGLMSLWDMINFRFSDAFWALELLRTQICSSGQSGMNNPVSAGDIKLTTTALDRTEAACKKIGFDGPLSPIMRARLDLTYPDLINRDLVRIVSTVRESFADEIRGQYFFHYPCSRVGSLLRVHDEWKAVLESFKSCIDDVTHGVDCWVSGHHTASVFYMMRVAEVGLRAVAKERKVATVRKNTTLDYGQWGDIIDAIETKAKGLLQVKAGPNKDAALAFYSGAASHSRALKDKYRNRVMHAREAFNEHEAADAIFHTKSFMDGLASKLNETTRREIRWGMQP